MIMQVLRHIRPLLTSLWLFWLVTALGLAQLPEMKEKWWKNPEIVKQLGLTAKQVDKIEKVMGEFRSRLISLKSELDRDYGNLNRLRSKENIDEAALRAEIDRIFAARAELEKVRMSMRIKVRDVLTPEQRVKLQEIYKEQPKNKKAPLP